nr:hypothetical protein [Tanacetum cinerariifolium]
QYTRRTRIAQSLVLPPIADEPASPLGDDSQGEACPTNSSLEADQDRDAEIVRIHAEEELQMMIDGLDRNNETVAKYLQEYHQFAAELPIGRRIEFISDLVKYQDNYAKVLKLGGSTTSYQFFVDLLKHFDREDLNQLWALVKETLNIRPAANDKEKELWVELKRLYEPDVKDLLWTHTQNRMHALVEWKLYDTCGVHHKQMQDFIPMSSKEEGERFKRKGLILEQESAKKVKITKEVPEEKLKEMMQLIPVEEVYVEALQVKHPIIDWEHFDREDLNQLWALVKETLIIRPAANDKEKELWVELKRLYEPDVKDLLWTHTQNLMHAPVEWKLYDTCGVHHVISKDQKNVHAS